MPLPTVEIAESSAAIARLAYMQDGEVAPVIQVHGHQQTICAQPLGDDADRLGYLIRQLIWLAEANFVTLINEAWIRSYDDDEIPDHVPRPCKTLSSDPLVRTGIVVEVYSTTDPDDHHAIISTVHTNDAGERSWEVGDFEGGDGDTPSMMRWIVTHPIDEVTPSEESMRELCRELMDEDVAEAIIAFPDR